MDTYTDETTDEQWNAAWEAALDDLELTLERAEELLTSSAPLVMPEWEPPQLSVPLPKSQLPRAKMLLDRNYLVVQEMAMAAAAVRRQLALSSKLSDSIPDASPVYLDISG